MKRIHSHSALLILIALLITGLITGCGSSSSSGSGAVTTAFITSGDVILRNGNGTIIPDVTGSVTNSAISIFIPPSAQFPCILEVTNGTLALGGAGKDKDLASPLKRLVRSDTEIDALYVSVFSTIEAETYLAACPNPKAEFIAKETLQAVVDSLGLKLEDVTNIDPRTSGKLEFAQQALFAVLGVEDAQGLKGLIDKIQELIANPAAGQGSFSILDFVVELKGMHPATTIADPNVRSAIADTARETFQNGKLAGVPCDPSTADIEISNATATVGKADYSQTPADIQTSTNEVWVHPGQVSSTGMSVGLCSVSGADMSNGSHEVQAKSSKVLVFTSPTKPSSDQFVDSTIAWKVIKNVGQSSNLWFKAPQNTAPGKYYTTINGKFDPPVQQSVIVNVVPQQIVQFSGINAAISHGLITPTKGGYLGFQVADGTILNTIPKGSTAHFTGIGSLGTKSSPALQFTLHKFGPKENARFTISFNAPNGLAFDLGNGARATTLKASIITTSDSFKVADEDAGIVELSKSFPDNQTILKFKNDVNLITTRDMPLDEVNFKILVEDPETHKVITTDTLSCFTLNLNSIQQIAEIEPLKFIAGTNPAKPGRIGCGVPHTGNEETVSMPLYGNTFACKVKTWEEKAGVTEGITKEINFDKLYLVTSHTFETGPGAIRQNKIEFTTTDPTQKSITYSGLTNDKLIIRVGNGTANEEQVHIEGHYTNGPKTLTSTRSLEFYSEKL